MKRVAIFTVGGSPMPIINAIKSENFDYIYFICSKGRPENASERLVDGEPIKEGEIIIAKETGLPKDKYEKILIELEYVDDIDKIYEYLETDLISRLKSRFRDEETLEIIANYTGGTKSMSIALALLALFQEGWQLQINVGPRPNLIKIDSGDTPVLISKENLNYKRELKYFDILMKKFYYDDISERTSEILKNRSLETKKRNMLLNLRNVMKVFILWDKFDHNNAIEMLENLLNSLDRNSEMFECLNNYRIWGKKITGKIKSSGYCKVIDLILNAERRVIQERYDDAVARYYRVIEMMAQIRLKNEYKIDSSEINCNEIDVLPEKVRNYLRGICEKARDEKGKVKIGLVGDYELLAAFDDILGKFYLDRKKYLLNALERRNNSILAHGEKPILKEEFEEIQRIFREFILEGLKKIGVNTDEGLQFPRSLKEIGFE
ncbi:MAG: TIGR02710 family CRISPR-associated CARF protein [Thermodesulfovibrio sp.]|nr:TIGR02710 family CRISPR-associated CARF protein [Thermodesulfovibrio sp.]MDW7998497.1 TIGR02710 family CRISPR-associated CARF protein [Thermodesulfovibrio sp.]